MRHFVFLQFVLAVGTAAATDFHINGQKLTVSDGLVVELIAGQPLVERPVSADFDERGRLYVTESSGSNEPAKVQQEKRPHRILRLEDSDGDGTFDHSSVFADRLMFPEGALWFDGSLYVAAPPEIWKFTDADDDGVAERRDVWFDGKTLTGCANDLHGPYLGPDGWIYWCKGAFAEQTYEQLEAAPLKTRAAHIFRRRPEGGPIEHVMTGGMDNPVELIFTPGGERIFTTTFLVHPSQGNRDGLLHAVYGGVYGKEHGVLDTHPRTGDLMPVLWHHGASASCGLSCLECDGLGVGYCHNLLETSFNRHSVVRHKLKKHGATFQTTTSQLLVSDNLDFHPTDVLEDADGSVIVVDTGGWFRLCCPTSQLEKPDVLGGIYRIRRSDATPVADPRGLSIPWESLAADQLVQQLSDERHAVRSRARRLIAKQDESVLAPLRRILRSSPNADDRREAVWAATQLATSSARDTVRIALNDSDALVRQAALHSVSVWKDADAVETVAKIVQHGTAQNRRAAAEALGRIGAPKHIPVLLGAIPSAALPVVQAQQADDSGRHGVDRFLEHSLIYAAMEIESPATLRSMIHHRDSYVRRAALIALDQLRGGDYLQAAEIQPLLMSEDEVLNEAAWWIADFHPDWGDAVAEAFDAELRQAEHDGASLKRLQRRLVQFSASSAVQGVMAETLRAAASDAVRLTVLNAMAGTRLRPPPPAWSEQLAAHLTGADTVVQAALSAMTRLNDGKLSTQTVRQLARIVENPKQASELRLRALTLLPTDGQEVPASTVEFVCENLTIESDLQCRSLAVDFLKAAPLTDVQRVTVAQRLPDVGAMELRPLLTVFEGTSDLRVGEQLVAALLTAPAATSLFPDQVSKVVAGFGTDIASKAEPLLEKIAAENRSKVERVEQALALLPTADVRRGLRVFQSPQASCIACHRRGYLGGNIGPDLNRIGQVRSERDLLESILFPSLTFVRSYEPITIVTDDGLVHSGLIRDETTDDVTLQLDAQKSIVIPKSGIDERLPGTVSIMPAGLEKQLTPQQLADLVKYLKEE